MDDEKIYESLAISVVAQAVEDVVKGLTYLYPVYGKRCLEFWNWEPSSALMHGFPRYFVFTDSYNGKKVIFEKETVIPRDVLREYVDALYFINSSRLRICTSLDPDIIINNSLRKYLDIGPRNELPKMCYYKSPKTEVSNYIYAKGAKKRFFS